MGLIEQIRDDIEQITTNSDEFGVPITLTSPGGNTLEMTALHTRHHLGIDTDGNLVDTPNIHIGISENVLIKEGYPYRNSAGKVDLKNHRVTGADSSGTDVQYKVVRWFPDETAGLIVCILGEYE